MDTLDLIKEYLPVCGFKKNPAHLPRSTRFLKQNILLSVVVEYFMQLNMIDDPFEAFLEVGLQTLLSIMFIAFVLTINKTLYHFVQVATAVFYCGNVLSILVVPVAIWITVTDHPASYVMGTFLLLWEFGLVAYIMKESLEVDTLAGVILSITYFLGTYLAAFGIAQVI